MRYRSTRENRSSSLDEADFGSDRKSELGRCAAPADRGSTHAKHSATIQRTRPQRGEASAARGTGVAGPGRKRRTLHSEDRVSAHRALARRALGARCRSRVRDAGRNGRRQARRDAVPRDSPASEYVQPYAGSWSSSRWSYWGPARLRTRQERAGRTNTKRLRDSRRGPRTPAVPRPAGQWNARRVGSSGDAISGHGPHASARRRLLAAHRRLDRAHPIARTWFARSRCSVLRSPSTRRARARPRDPARLTARVGRVRSRISPRAAA